MKVIKASNQLIISNSINTIFYKIDDVRNPYDLNIEVYDLNCLTNDIFKNQKLNYLDKEDIEKLDLTNEDDLEEYNSYEYVSFKSEHDKRIGSFSKKDKILEFNFNDNDSDNILKLFKFIAEYKDKSNGIDLVENFNLEKAMKIKRDNDGLNGPKLITYLMSHILHNLNLKIESFIMLNIEGTDDYVFGNSNNIAKSLNLLKTKYPNLDELTINGLDFGDNDLYDGIVFGVEKDKSFVFNGDSPLDDLIKNKIFNLKIENNLLTLLYDNSNLGLNEVSEISITCSFEKYCENNNKEMLLAYQEVDDLSNDLKFNF